MVPMNNYDSSLAECNESRQDVSRLSSQMNIQKLIILVRDRHEIYDHRHPKHTDREYIYNAWDSIARQLNTTVREVKIKWQNLRSNYMREKRKLRRLNLLGTEYKQQISWHYFELLSFLEESLNHKARVRDGNYYTNQPIISNYVNIEDSVEKSEMALEQKNEQQNEDDHVPTSSSSSSYLQEENQIDIKIKTENNEFSNSVESHSISLERLRNFAESIEMETNKQRYHLDISPKIEEDYDPDFMFLKSLLPTMKKLGPIENLEFRGEVINLLKRKLETCLY